MIEIKLTKRYPHSRTEDITDAYMRGWNDALDAVQNGKFHIPDYSYEADFGNRITADRKTEPTGYNLLPVEDEPQLTPNYCGTCRHRDVPCGDLPCDVCHGYSNYAPKDEPQTDTEIAKAIVHKMIDDAVIAEDAYPNLRQRLHDAVDEYEPQTDCAWRRDDG